MVSRERCGHRIPKKKGRKSWNSTVDKKAISGFNDRPCPPIKPMNKTKRREEFNSSLNTSKAEMNLILHCKLVSKSVSEGMSHSRDIIHLRAGREKKNSEKRREKISACRDMNNACDSSIALWEYVRMSCELVFICHARVYRWEHLGVLNCSA